MLAIGFRTLSNIELFRCRSDGPVCIMVKEVQLDVEEGILKEVVASRTTI
jgi:hypothetical protein